MKFSDFFSYFMTNVMLKKHFYPESFMKSVPAFMHTVSADLVSTTRKNHVYDSSRCLNGPDYLHKTRHPYVTV